MGIELYVSELKNSQNIGWMPLMRSGRIPHSEEQLIISRLKDFHSNLKHLRETLEKEIE